MNTDISEFSYGFALTSELIERFGLHVFGAPKFPSLYEEGKKGGGYDMKLPGIPFYIQFKKSDKLTRKNAKDAKTLGIPYYRFGIRPEKSSKQHQLLLDLEADENLVLYAAPIFSKPEELDKYYSARSVIENSIFIKPRKIGKLLDDKPHTLSFKSTNVAIFRSEPVRVEADAIDVEIESIRLRNGEEGIRTIRNEIDRLASIYSRGAVGVGSDRGNQLRSLERDRLPIEHLVYMSRNLFGVEILFVE